MMTSHQLAKQLLEMPDLPVSCSVDLSEDGNEKTYSDRAHGTSIHEIVPTQRDIVLCFELGDLNFKILHRYNRQ